MQPRKYEKFLVTGGAGFIGSHLVDYLIGNGARVAVVDDLSTGREENINPRARFYELDASAKELASVFQKEKPEVVYHFAFNTNVPLSIRNPLFDAQSIDCSLNTFVNAVEFGVKKVVMASSSFIYGNTHVLPLTESHPPQPVSPYAISKIASEHYLRFFFHTYGLPVVIFRYGTVYGPRQVGGAMADYIRTIAKDERAAMYGDGNITRDYVFVDDIVAANLKALEVADGHPPLICNIGSNTETTLNSLYSMIATLLGKPENKPVYKPARAGEIIRLVVCYEKANKELGWRPIVDLRQGLKKTLRHYKLM
jgi:UDP-glucose 4-epimerase